MKRKAVKTNLTLVPVLHVDFAKVDLIDAKATSPGLGVQIKALLASETPAFFEVVDQATQIERRNTLPRDFVERVLVRALDTDLVIISSLTNIKNAASVLVKYIVWLADCTLVLVREWVEYTHSASSR